MATFKSKEGVTIEEDSRKMKLAVDGTVYYRVYAPKFVSRQDRLINEIGNIKNIIDFLDEILEAISHIFYKEDCKKVYTSYKSKVGVLSLDFPEVRKLMEEMCHWKDQIVGTGLERTTRYKEVEAASDDLIEAFEMVGDLELLDDKLLNDIYHTELRFLRDELIVLTNKLWRVYLPPMYG